MTVQALPATGAFLSVPGTNHNSDMAARFEAFLAFARAMIGGGDEKTYTVASASIAPDSASCIVDLPAGTPSGNLDTIATTNLPLGFVLFLRSADPSRVPTIRNGRGTAAQFLSADGSDRVLTSTTMLLAVQRKSNGWRELIWYPGAATASWLSFLGLSWAQTVAALATQTEAVAGTDATKLITALTNREAQVDPSWVAALPIASTAVATNFLPLYDGTQLVRVATQTALLGAPCRPYTRTDAAVAGSFAQANHGLGIRPRLVTAYLLCNTADHGFAPGMLVGSPDVLPYADTTVCGWTSASPIRVADGAGGLPSITVARWSIVNTAYV